MLRFRWRDLQIAIVAMVSPISPVIADFFMEVFEKTTFDRAAHKILCWLRYVDDTLRHLAE